MVKSTSFITTENDKKFFLTRRLTCDNYRIYAAQRKMCHQIYVGQTENIFSIRLANHRTFSKSSNAQTHSHKAVLLLHFHNYHINFISSQQDISEYFRNVLLGTSYFHKPSINSFWCRLHITGLINYKLQ